MPLSVRLDKGEVTAIRSFLSLGISPWWFHFLSGIKERPMWKCGKGHHSMLPTISMGVCELGHGQLEKGKTVQLCGVQRKETSLL